MDRLLVPAANTAVSQPDSTCDGPRRESSRWLNGVDASLHLFYEVSRAELQTLLEQIVALRKSATGVTSAAFGPHPILESEGAAGQFATKLFSALPRAQVEAAYAAALRIENPSKHSPETIDCASCHTTHARAAAETALGLTPSASPDAYATELRGIGMSSSENVHAFSYGVKGVQISQRTANETDATVRYVNANMLRK